MVHFVTWKDNRKSQFIIFIDSYCGNIPSHPLLEAENTCLLNTIKKDIKEPHKDFVCDIGKALLLPLKGLRVLQFSDRFGPARALEAEIVHKIINKMYIFVIYNIHFLNVLVTAFRNYVNWTG